MTGELPDAIVEISVDTSALTRPRPAPMLPSIDLNLHRDQVRDRARALGLSDASIDAVLERIDATPWLDGKAAGAEAWSQLLDAAEEQMDWLDDLVRERPIGQDLRRFHREGPTSEAQARAFAAWVRALPPEDLERLRDQLAPIFRMITEMAQVAMLSFQRSMTAVDEVFAQQSSAIRNLRDALERVGAIDEAPDPLAPEAAPPAARLPSARAARQAAAGAPPPLRPSLPTDPGGSAQ